MQQNIKPRTPWHALSVAETLKELQVSETGITNREATRRIERYGKNSTDDGSTVSLARIFFRQWISPIIGLLCAAAIISFALGAVPDGIFITIAVMLSVGFGFLEEARSERTLKTLKDTLKRSSTVLRDGKPKEINIEFIVPGDILVVKEGDVIAADARLLEGRNLETDESILTGESLPVAKETKAVAETTPLAERTSLLLKGTTVTSGAGHAIVTETGMRTEFGAIAKSLASIKEEPTPLQEQTKKLARMISIALFFAFIGIIALGIHRDIPLGHLLIISVATIAAAIPEALPVSITSMLALGMFRLLKHNALVKKLTAAETLGSVSVICTDKTGTLTTGNMRVTSMFALSDAAREKALDLMAQGTSAQKDENNTFTGPKTECALLEAALKNGRADLVKSRSALLLRDIPFSPAHRFRASIIERDGEHVLIVIGAPEALLKRSTHVADKRSAKLTNEEKDRFENEERRAAREKKHILAIAYRHIKASETEADPEELAKNLTLVAYAMLEDPLRDSVPHVIQKAHDAGIRIIMITGDSPITGAAIAKEAGIENAGAPVTGPELEAMNEAEFQRVVRTTNVFARTTPELKLRLLETLMRQGETVAMIGDGINDAPALKRADIGVAMGSAQDVSKEAADLILLDNNFKTLVVAIEEGRRIFDNIRKAIFFLLYGNLTEIFLVATALIQGFPLPLLAAQILWVKLIEDSLPAFAMSFEPPERDVMKAPTGKQKSGLFGKEYWTALAVFATANAVLLTFLYWILLPLYPLDAVRTIIFIGLGTDSFVTVFALKSLRKPLYRINPFTNKPLIAALGIGAFLYAIAILIAPLRSFLSLGTPPENAILYLAGLGAIYLVLIELIKWLFFREKSLKIA